MKNVVTIAIGMLISLFAAETSADDHILGIGSPCIDILLDVEDEFLHTIPGDKGGSLQVDWFHFSKIIEHSQTRNPTITTGGSSSNTIKGLASLKQPCAFYGKIGNDKMGKFYLDTILPLGIIPKLITTDTPTAQVACLITPDKKRTMRSYPGAGNELTGEDINPEIFEGVKHIHFEGYVMYNDSLAEEAMKMAKELGVTISFDMGSFEVVKLFKKDILHLITKYVDIVFANEDEAHALTDLPSQESCEMFKDLCPIAVVLIGADGCWVGAGDKIFCTPGFSVEVEDTTGAGDLFASGFLHGYMKGKNLEVCARYGNFLGSRVVMFHGAEIPKAVWPEVLDFFEE